MQIDIPALIKQTERNIKQLGELIDETKRHNQEMETLLTVNRCNASPYAGKTQAEINIIVDLENRLFFARRMLSPIPR